MNPLRPLLILAALAPLAVAEPATYDAPPISYSTTKPSDPATHLQARLDAGDAGLDSDGRPLDLLASLLRELDIPVSSQTLVFSRTSLQRSSISPENPRALYFNDETYVGYVPGGRVIEVATTDPHLGTTFYTLDQRPAGSAAMKLRRQVDNCLSCHGGNMTRDLPGLLLRSVYPDPTGEPILPAGTFLTNHESPFDQRWGGWYVTGPLPGGSLANALFDESSPSDPKPVRTLDPAKSFDASNYLSAQSDPVALLVLAHQVEGHNRLTRALYGTELALRDEEIMAKALEEPVPVVNHSESTLRRIRHACDPLVEYLLFCNEPALPGPVADPTTFAADFAARGPKDPRGRSLRDLDLHTRLFKYPCSYLIYSPSFDALPAPALEYVYHRLYAVLTGQDASKPFDHLSPQDRQSILEILRATKPDLPDYWKQ
jgi:hypothetical protein